MPPKKLSNAKAGKGKSVTLIDTPSSPNSNIKETQSQTDASEWVEYETDMKELYENLKNEGIDVPVDEKGVPILTPQFIKNLPPSVQPHAGGKKYAGNKPFKSTLGPPPKGFLGREIQTRTSIWEEYKKELNELYKMLEKNGVQVPRDDDGIPIYNEELVKRLPPEDVPHPAGKEFAPIPGVEPLPDGTRVSPRLTLRMLTPALEVDLLRKLKKKGITVPMKNGKVDLTPDFIRSVPPELIQSVLKPVYDNQKKLIPKRESAIRKLSLEHKNNLKNKLEQKGITVKTTNDGEPIIPMITIMQFTEEEISQIVGDETSHEIFMPPPERVEIMPDDVIADMSKEQRASLGAKLYEQGLSVDVDEENIPIITKTNVHFLPQETLDKFEIAVTDIVAPSKTDISEFDKRGSKKKSRTTLRTGRGLFNLTRKNVKELLTKRLEAAGVEIRMTTEGEIELNTVPDEIVTEFAKTIQDELKQIDAQDMHQRIFAMMEEDRQLICDQLEMSGIELPKNEETGEKVITVEFLEKLPRDVLINLLAKLFSSPRTSLDAGAPPDAQAEDVQDHKSSSGKATSEHEDVELDLTDDQLYEFYDRLIEEGVHVPLDDITGRPKFTREFVRTIPKKIAREIISVAQANAEEGERKYSFISEDSDEEEEEEDARKSQYKASEKTPTKSKPESSILGIRYAPDGIAYVADDKGDRVKFDQMVQRLKHAYSLSDLKKHDEINKEKEAQLRAQIREERRHEDKDPEIKRAGSEVEMQQMAMRFIPEYNPRPEKTDPINLFRHDTKFPVEHSSFKAGSQGPQKGVEFVHLLEPTFPPIRIDSMATVPSTVARRFSKDSVRGSALSTRLSDLPSMFSQPLVDDQSSAFFMSASTQSFDISPESVRDYREKWLGSFMSGYTPKQTITICIINMITRKQIELRVVKENTVNEICHMYMQYEDHPEYYVWKDIYGRLLAPDKTLIENGLVRQDEVLEFQGYRRMPLVLLYFRDGFENDPPLPLHPIHALKQREPGLCRNY